MVLDQGMHGASFGSASATATTRASGFPSRLATRSSFARTWHSRETSSLSLPSTARTSRCRTPFPSASIRCSAISRLWCNRLSAGSSRNFRCFRKAYDLRSLVEAALEVPRHLDRRVHDLISTLPWRIPVADHVEPLECVYQCVQGTRSDPAVQSDWETRRLLERQAVAFSRHDQSVPTRIQTWVEVFKFLHKIRFLLIRLVRVRSSPPGFLLPISVWRAWAVVPDSTAVSFALLRSWNCSRHPPASRHSQGRPSDGLAGCSALTRQGTWRLLLGCSEQGKLPTPEELTLAERDKHMSEQEDVDLEKLNEALLPICWEARINGKWSRAEGIMPGAAANNWSEDVWWRSRWASVDWSSGGAAREEQPRRNHEREAFAKSSE